MAICILLARLVLLHLDCLLLNSQNDVTGVWLLQQRCQPDLSVSAEFHAATPRHNYPGSVNNQCVDNVCK